MDKNYSANHELGGRPDLDYLKNLGEFIRYLRKFRTLEDFSHVIRLAFDGIGQMRTFLIYCWDGRFWMALSNKFGVLHLQSERMDAILAHAANEWSGIDLVRMNYENSMGRSLTPEHLKVLQQMPLAELGPLLEEMTKKNGNDAAKFCIDTIYASQAKRILDERREFDAKTPPVNVEMSIR